jgi:hypothetical protein
LIKETTRVTDESDEVLSRVEDGVGFVTLNRPKAINSLNQDMVDELRAVLSHLGFADVFDGDFFAPLGQAGRRPHADDRGGRRTRAGWGLPTGDDMRRRHVVARKGLVLNVYRLCRRGLLASSR